MAYRPEPNDPFAGGQKTPALSWKGLPVGSVFTLEVLEPAKLLHSRNFETNEPDYWDAAKTQPKMSAVVNVTVLAGPHSVGEERSVWAQKPSNLFAAIAEAQTAAGARIDAGGVLYLKFSGETPHQNPRYSPIKQYAAKYQPPTQAHDPFSQQAAQPTQQTPPQPQPSAGWGRGAAGPSEHFPVPTQQPSGQPQPAASGVKGW